MRRWPYLKLWSEARTDAKLGSLTDAQHRVWFNLLCFASEQEERGRVSARLRVLAVEAARGDVALLRETCEALADLGMVSWEEGEGGACVVEFVNFAKRQASKESDTPEATRARKARSRAAAKSHAGGGDCHAMSRGVTPGHTPVTPLSRIDVEEEEEEEEEGEEYPPLTPPDGGRGGGGGKAAHKFDPTPGERERARAKCEAVFPGCGWGHLAEAACLDYPAAWVVEAIDASAGKNLRSWRFVASILKRYADQKRPDSASRPARAAPAALAPEEKERLKRLALERAKALSMS